MTALGPPAYTVRERHGPQGPAPSYAGLYNFCAPVLTGSVECDNMKRGEIYRADLDPVVGSEQGGIRPVLIIQNDIGNLHSPTVIVAAITSQMKKPRLPTHVQVSPGESGLNKPSVILLEQVRTLEKRRLYKYLGRVDAPVMDRVDRALGVSLGTMEGAASKE